MITEAAISTNTDTTIVAASPTTNYRTSDLTLSSSSGGSRIVAQFVLPTTVNPDAIVSAELVLFPKTIVGLNTTPTIQTSLLTGSLDYRYVTWNDYANASPWTTAGGDLISGTETVTESIQHSVSGRIRLNCLNSILYAYVNSKVYTINMLVSTASANANIIYYSYETVGNGPYLIVRERQPHTAERLGRSAGMPSIPSA